MDDKYKTKAQLRAELALLRQWLHESSSELEGTSEGAVKTRPDISFCGHDRSQAQLSALISASRAVFKKRSFSTIARSVFDLAKPVIGAEQGFVALSDESDGDLQIVSMELGAPKEQQTRNPAMPAHLIKHLFQSKKAFYQNDARSAWLEDFPAGHIDVDNILFSPLILKDSVVGVMALANKPGGFDRADLEITQAFCELLSISFANTRAYEALTSSEERFRQFFQHEPNYCLIIDSAGLITDINAAGQEALGCSREELCGQPWWSIYDAESQEWVKSQKPNYQDPFVFSNQLLSIISRQGIRRNVMVSMHEMHGERDGVQHYITVQNDVTRQVRIEAEQKQLISIYQEQSEILTESNMQLEAALNKVQESELKLQDLYQQEKTLHNELEAEIRKRADFTRTLVHELKTPLVPLVASASLLSEGLKEEPWQSIAVNIENGATNLSQRIDELLDVAKGEVGTLEVHLKNISLLPIINEVVRQSRDLIEVRKQKLVANIPDFLPPVRADAGRISQVITNVVNNASKYTPGGGTITLEVSALDGFALIAVRDTGLGIPLEDQGQIFSSYYRASNSRSQYQGMGIGLFLCKKIMELHNGDITLESSEGEGSVFTLKLPLLKENESRKGISAAAHSFLVITDDEETLEKLTSGFEEVWPGSGIQVCRSEQDIPRTDGDNHFDTIVLDLGLPCQDSEDLLKRLKSSPGSRIIVLTTAEDHEKYLETATENADGIFIKPFEKRVLINYLKRMLD